MPVENKLGQRVEILKLHRGYGHLCMAIQIEKRI